MQQAAGTREACNHRRQRAADAAPGADLDAVRRRAAVGGSVVARQRRHARQVRGDHVRARQRQRNGHDACARGARSRAGAEEPDRRGKATTTFAVVSLSTGTSCRHWLLPFLATARRVPLGCSPNTPLCSAHAWPAGPVCRDQAHNRTAVEARPRRCYKGRAAQSRGSMCRTHTHNSARLVLRAFGGATGLAACPRAGAAPVPVPRSTARTSAHCPNGGARSRYSASTNALCHTTWRRIRI